MTRGNQRDEARLKNAKDAAGKGVKIMMLAALHGYNK
jgi:hypothetical protein